MKTSCKCFLLLPVLLASAIPALASVPPVINYQGRLTQPSGAPVADGTYSMLFSIYDVPTGGTALWSETNTSVQVNGGLFAVMLGSVINLPANLFDSPTRYFAVQVGSDPEMTPRQQIASVGFAIKAESADLATTVPDAAITTDKLDSASVTTDKLAAGTITADKIALSTITADRLAPGVAIPVGTILMWSGAVTNIPTGWALCDGTSGTPNLTDKFIIGAGSTYAVGGTGGEATHTLTIAEMPSHSHGPQSNLYNQHLWLGGSAYLRNILFFDEPQYQSFRTADTGGNVAHENRPPYYALCFIMKLAY